MSTSTTSIPEAKKVGMVSLGCPKALVDSERILTRLRADGYAMSPDYAGADVVLVATEWKQFREADPAVLAEVVGSAKIIDGRNCLPAEKWIAEGWEYHGLGRFA